MDSLYDDADLYDLVAPRDDEMERFYVEAAGGPGRIVLELACGSKPDTAGSIAHRSHHRAAARSAWPSPPSAPPNPGT
jgi:hypothetical protein